jgi:hypothetical protein
MSVDRSHWVNMQCKRTVNLPCLILELLPFVHVYTLNLVRNITMKLLEVSKINCKVDISHWVDVQYKRTVTLPCLILDLLPFVQFTL